MQKKLVVSGYDDNGVRVEAILPVPARFEYFKGLTLRAEITERLVLNDFVVDADMQAAINTVIQVFADRGDKIGAIKFIRTFYFGMTGNSLGLKDAKDFVEGNFLFIRR